MNDDELMSTWVVAYCDELERARLRFSDLGVQQDAAFAAGLRAVFDAGRREGP